MPEPNEPPPVHGRLLRAPNDLIAGLFLLACAGLAWHFGQNLSVGTAYRMGPGYIPRLLTWIVLAFGVLLVLGAFRLQGPQRSRWPLKPIVLIIGAMVVFSQVIEHGGLAIASALVVLMASMAAPGGRWRDALMLATALTVGVCLLFPIVLQLPLRILPR